VEPRGPDDEQTGDLWVRMRDFLRVERVGLRAVRRSGIALGVALVAAGLALLAIVLVFTW
jgi:hypothetical protein